MPRTPKKSPQEILVELIHQMDVESLEKLQSIIGFLIEEKLEPEVEEESELIARLAEIQAKKNSTGKIVKPKIKKIVKQPIEDEDEEVIEEESRPTVRRTRQQPKMGRGKGERPTRTEPIPIGPRRNKFEDIKLNSIEAKEVALASKVDKKIKRPAMSPRREPTLVEVTCDSCNNDVVISEKLYFPKMRFICDDCIPKGA